MRYLKLNIPHCIKKSINCFFLWIVYDRYLWWLCTNTAAFTATFIGNWIFILNKWSSQTSMRHICRRFVEISIIITEKYLLCSSFATNIRTTLVLSVRIRFFELLKTGRNETRIERVEFIAPQATVSFMKLNANITRYKTKI